ncbi:MAG TPA: hypothetical protein VMT77_01715 [Gemmatimonadales bacterium]|nr:hypothetical protein [Gemmatimonadales bacterium]
MSWSGTARRSGLLVAGLVAGAAASATAQKAEWTDVVYVPGRWVAGHVVAQPDSLALVMRVDYFASPPRWRAEVRRTSDGQTLGPADVIVGSGQHGVVVTQLGTTPLEQHVLGRDPLVRALVVFDVSGRRTGAAAGRITERAADGTVTRVVFRRAARTADFDAALLDPGAKAGGRTLLASGISAVGDQRSASVVATAGARGVDRVQTPGGSVPVTPDTMAIVRMEHYSVGAMALEAFLRAGGLGAYAVPADTTGRHP